jgi:hypothetical protein
MRGGRSTGAARSLPTLAKTGRLPGERLNAALRARTLCRPRSGRPVLDAVDRRDGNARASRQRPEWEPAALPRLPQAQPQDCRSACRSIRVRASRVGQRHLWGRVGTLGALQHDLPCTGPGDRRGRWDCSMASVCSSNMTLGDASGRPHQQSEPRGRRRCPAMPPSSTPYPPRPGRMRCGASQPEPPDGVEQLGCFRDRRPRPLPTLVLTGVLGNARVGVAEQPSWKPAEGEAEEPPCRVDGTEEARGAPTGTRAHGDHAPGRDGVCPLVCSEARRNVAIPIVVGHVASSWTHADVSPQGSLPDAADRVRG